MEKKKIVLISFVSLLVVALVGICLFVGLNWSKFKSAFIDKTQLYTYEELVSAKQQGYSEANLDKSNLEIRINEYQNLIISYENDIASLTSSNSSKQGQIDILNSQILLLQEEIENMLSVIDEDLYILVFNSNSPNGVSAQGSMSILYGDVNSSFNLPACGYSVEHYSFAGWNTEADGTGTSYSNLAQISVSTFTGGTLNYLYAKWSVEEYTVSYDLNNWIFDQYSSDFSSLERCYNSCFVNGLNDTSNNVMVNHHIVSSVDFDYRQTFNLNFYCYNADMYIYYFDIDGAFQIITPCCSNNQVVFEKTNNDSLPEYKVRFLDYGSLESFSIEIRVLGDISITGYCNHWVE